MNMIQADPGEKCCVCNKEIRLSGKGYRVQFRHCTEWDRKGSAICRDCYKLGNTNGILKLSIMEAMYANIKPKKIKKKQVNRTVLNQYFADGYNDTYAIYARYARSVVPEELIPSYTPEREMRNYGRRRYSAESLEQARVDPRTLEGIRIAARENPLVTTTTQHTPDYEIRYIVRNPYSDPLNT